VQWQKIREHQQWIAIYNSSDDPHIPIAEARFVAAQLRCSYVELTDRGHFVDSRQFPEIVDLVRRKIGA
jgi:predicted alpha/beta hydrolase family esterase